jgi:hypothetical protein
MSLSLTNLSKGDAKMKCQLFNWTLNRDTRKCRPSLGKTRKGFVSSRSEHELILFVFRRQKRCIRIVPVSNHHIPSLGRYSKRTLAWNRCLGGITGAWKP